ncbi:MAG: hypothetical protein Q8S13_05850, partial [Dehalococcoidia bacterium]|nr:hypothetical protein [Dehalococcoidia bacterium]
MLTKEDLQALSGMFGGIGRAGGGPSPMDRRYAVTSGAKEIISEPVYDRVNIPTAVPASISFFTQGIVGYPPANTAGATLSNAGQGRIGAKYPLSSSQAALLDRGGPPGRADPGAAGGRDVGALGEARHRTLPGRS